MRYLTFAEWLLYRQARRKPGNAMNLAECAIVTQVLQRRVGRRVIRGRERPGDRITVRAWERRLARWVTA